MKAYSTDLRQRVIAAYQAEQGTQRQIADRFCVSIQWVRKILYHHRHTGSIEPKPHGGGRARVIDREAGERLRQAVADRPDATLAELAQAADVAASPAMVHRALVGLGITRKKSRGGPPSRINPSGRLNGSPG